MRISDCRSDVCSSDRRHAESAGGIDAAEGKESVESIGIKHAGKEELPGLLVVRQQAQRAQQALQPAAHGPGRAEGGRCLPHHEEQRQGEDSEPQTHRSEEHTYELQSLMRITYSVFFLKKKKNTKNKEVTTK